MLGHIDPPPPCGGLSPCPPYRVGLDRTHLARRGGLSRPSPCVGLGHTPPSPCHVGLGFTHLAPPQCIGMGCSPLAPPRRVGFTLVIIVVLGWVVLTLLFLLIVFGLLLLLVWLIIVVVEVVAMVVVVTPRCRHQSGYALSLGARCYQWAAGAVDMWYLPLDISGGVFSEKTEDKNEPRNIVVHFVAHRVGFCPPPSCHISALLLVISLPLCSSLLPPSSLLCTLRIHPLLTSAKTNHDKCCGSCFATHHWGIPLHGSPDSSTLPGSSVKQD